MKFGKVQPRKNGPLGGSFGNFVNSLTLLTPTRRKTMKIQIKKFTYPHEQKEEKKNQKREQCQHDSEQHLSVQKVPSLPAAEPPSNTLPTAGEVWNRIKDRTFHFNAEGRCDRCGYVVEIHHQRNCPVCLRNAAGLAN